MPYLTGSQPRILPPSAEEVGEDAMESIAALLKAQGKPGRRELPVFIATMMRRRSQFQAMADMSTQLFAGALMFRDVELVLLRTSWLCQAPFVWGEHVRTAREKCGFTSEDIERIVEGSSAPGWDEHSRAVLLATEELHETAHISAETWAELARHLDENQLIDLPMLAGHVHSTAYLQNALQTPLMEGNAGLEAR